MIGIIPAIDLYENKCVRLVKGDFSEKKEYDADPIITALEFEKQGAKLIHIVDLEGAKIGSPVHYNMLERIKNAVKIPLEIGGGIRNDYYFEKLVDLGVERIVLGTVLVKNKEFATRILNKYPEKVVFGIDSREDKVSISGWTEETNWTVIELIRHYQEYGLKNVIYTDIERDGILQGPNITMLNKILENTEVDLVASGGISSLEDLIKLKRLNSSKLFGIIAGKAIYENKFSIREAVLALSAFE